MGIGLFMSSFHLSPNMLGIGRGGLHVKIPRFAFCVTILANGKCAVWLSPRSILQTPPTAYSSLQIRFGCQAIVACKKSLPFWIRMQKSLHFRTMSAQFPLIWLKSSR